MELLIHSGDDYVESFEPESLGVLVFNSEINFASLNNLTYLYIDICEAS